MKAYKGFDKNMQCRGFQYAEGGEYETDKAVPCESGFHACPYPLDCFRYYTPSNSIFCEVEQDGDVVEQEDKAVSTKIKIGARLDIAGLGKATFEYIKEHCTDENKVTNSGYKSMASNSGDSSMASNSGYRSMASNSGDRSMASNSGDCSMASADHETAIAVSWGFEGKVRGVFGATIVCAEWKWNGSRYDLLHSKLARVDGKTIKENTFYTLKDGELVEVADDD